MTAVMLTAALGYAGAGWPVFPVSRRKVPMTEHGMLDASTDVEQVRAWWTTHPRANIGMRPPTTLAIIDIDPRNGGLESWGALEAEHGTLDTLTVWSGRGDGGRHLYLCHPGGKLRAKIADGIDVKTHSGLVVLPPSIHAATGAPYTWGDPTVPVAPMPLWLAKLAMKPIEPPKPRYVPLRSSDADSIADWFTETRTWNHVLEPHGWFTTGGRDGDGDGSRWLHPAHSSDTSATIKYGQLFVYTPNTVFEQTTAEDARGYTRFRAFAMLAHGGDLSAAARAARALREGVTA